MKSFLMLVAGLRCRFHCRADKNGADGRPLIWFVWIYYVGYFERGKAAYMAKNKTEIYVSAVYDGQLDATDVFVDLIAQKYRKSRDFTEIV